jgi:photosystem II stability/assembly factor-like uncharacterized protein
MSRRIVRPALAIGLLGLLVALATGLPSARGQDDSVERKCGPTRTDVVRDGSFTTVDVPKDMGRLKAFAAGGDNGAFLLATDGRKVFRSTNGGCNWEPTFSLENPPVPGLEGVVSNVTALLVPEGGSRAILVLGGTGRALQSRILYSEDFGKTFKESTGLPQVGGVRAVVSAPSAPDVIYATVGYVDPAGDADAAGVTGALYASTDGGKTFASKSTGSQIERLAVEQVRPQVLWIVRANGAVEKSDDGGTTFQPVAVPAAEGAETDPGRWRDVAVYADRRFPTVVALSASPAREADIERVVVSDDGGAKFNDIDTEGLGPAPGLIFGNSASQLYAAVGSDSTAFKGPGFLSFEIGEQRWRDIDDLDLISLRDPVRASTPAAPGDGFRSIFMRRDVQDPEPGRDQEDQIVSFRPPPDPGTETPLGRRNCGTQPKEFKPKREPVRFVPGDFSVKLQPGTPAREGLEARLPPLPTPIDVNFLIDNSESMEPAIEGLFCSVGRLMKELPEKGVDAHFALTAYNDVVRYTYRRLVDMSAPSGAIADQLKLLFTLRGAWEPLRSALFQIATGAGLEAETPNPDRVTNLGPPGAFRVKRTVPPGQQVNFRDDAVRLTLVITDEPFEEDTEGEPPRQQVVDALKAKRIKTVGIRVLPPAAEQTNPNDTDHTPVRLLTLRQQLEFFARSTDTLAPRGGVDCDGGGSPDVAEGQPLVCDINETGIKSEIDDLIISILRSVRDIKPAELVVRETSGLDVKLEGGNTRDIDLKKRNEIPATAVISCTQEQAGKKYPISFDVKAAGKVVGTLEGNAQCGELPVAAVPPVVPRKKAEPQTDPPQKQPAADRPAAPSAPPKPATPPAAPTQIPQPAAAAAPPPPPPAPAPISSVPAQATAPANAPANASAAAGQPAAAAQRDRQVASSLAVVTTDEGGAGDHAIVDSTNRTRGDYAMVATKPAAGSAPASAAQSWRPAAAPAQSPVPLPAVFTLGIGISALLVYVAIGNRPRRRQLTAVRADGQHRRLG